MNNVSKDKGVIFVLLERFNKQRYPRLLKMKKLVDSGELLSKHDHSFIKTVQTDAAKIRQLVERNPEYQEIYDKALNILNEIIDRDLENQKK